MIKDLDETIKQLLVKKGQLNHGEVDIKFETPDREWSASLSRPTVNLYLYDIRENHELRGVEWIIEKNGNNTATRRKNARRINLSYLVTVWTNNVDDQHGLLWRVLCTLMRHSSIPRDLLIGKLAEQEYTILTHTAQPDGLFSNPADFWAALDNEIKPSFNYVVTLPMDPEMAFTSALARTSSLSVNRPDAEDSEPETLIAISGRVFRKGQPDNAIPGAVVAAREANMTAATNEKGQYIFKRIPSGKQTLQVTLPGEKPRSFTVTVPDKNYDIEI
ncbi:MAG: DUF4255 domain-containing protein [Dehalococcoidales bacterium]|nr:DUF4255 domain-containing protein [Dehalococcoidales bacterium]